MTGFIIPVIISCLIVLINFISLIWRGKVFANNILFHITEVWSIIIVPVFFLAVADFGQENNCCTDSALFSPQHRLSMYVLIGVCMAAYFYASFRPSIAAPLAELVIHSLLVTGIVLNVLLFIHIYKQDLGVFYSVTGNLPIILLFVMQLVKKQRLLIQNFEQTVPGTGSKIQGIAMKILAANPLVKFPLLFLFMLPVLLCLSLLLLLFGQKPDAVIRAFTDTYKHGFSQLDYMCDNVQCGGHYLCSVAANGHQQIVQPERLGERNGSKIICNRQLLISNAFEELIQEKFPFLHKVVRRKYNKVGDFIHRYYTVFNNKFFADLIYILMKPLEWIFLLVLYSFDQKPENRIASQYLSKAHRLMLKADENAGKTIS